MLSDVHLSQAHPDDPSDPFWMRYRRRAHHPDDDFAALVAHLLAASEDPIEVVFNGDVFDFDTPWVKDGTSTFDELGADARGCAAHVRLILDDHPVFFRAVARLLAEGHEVTFISGNHDIELYWPDVRRAIHDALAVHVVALGAAADGFDARLRFRSWFHITPDRIYFEHGSQYDIHNVVRHPAIPLTLDETRIHPVFGKLAFKRIGSRLGYFNPYYEETFYMGLSGYVGHFVRFYLRSHRHIGRVWAAGALRTLREIWKYRHDDERIHQGRIALRNDIGPEADAISDEAIDRTHALRARLGEETMLPILRELWIDRLAIAVVVLVVVLVPFAVLGWIAGAIALGVAFVLVLLYELSTPKPDVRTYDSAPESVLSLFDIHRVRAVCMGHTHRPFARREAGGLYANSGSWCPAFVDRECTRPVLDRRPVLWLTTRGEELRGGLHWWGGGVLAPADAAGGDA